MSEKPPLCWLDVCNVRTWTLLVSSLEISINFLNILFIAYCNILSHSSISAPILYTIARLLAHIQLIYFNIQLRKGVLQHVLAHVRNWLLVYLVLYTILTCYWFIIVFEMVFGDFQDTDLQELDKYLRIKKIEHFILFVIIEVLRNFFFYPVYQFYKFEKKRLQQTTAPEQKTV